MSNFVQIGKDIINLEKIYHIDISNMPVDLYAYCTNGEIMLTADDAVAFLGHLRDAGLVTIIDKPDPEPELDPGPELELEQRHKPCKKCGGVPHLGGYWIGENYYRYVLCACGEQAAYLLTDEEAWAALDAMNKPEPEPSQLAQVIKRMRWKVITVPADAWEYVVALRGIPKILRGIPGELDEAGALEVARLILLEVEEML